MFYFGGTEEKNSNGEGFFLVCGCIPEDSWPHAAISDPGVAKFHGVQVHVGRADT